MDMANKWTFRETALLIRQRDPRKNFRTQQHPVEASQIEEKNV